MKIALCDQVVLQKLTQLGAEDTRWFMGSFDDGIVYASTPFGKVEASDDFVTIFLIDDYKPSWMFPYKPPVALSTCDEDCWVLSSRAFNDVFFTNHMSPEEIIDSLLVGIEGARSSQAHETQLICDGYIPVPKFFSDLADYKLVNGTCLMTQENYDLAVSALQRIVFPQDPPTVTFTELPKMGLADLSDIASVEQMVKDAGLGEARMDPDFLATSPIAQEIEANIDRQKEAPEPTPITEVMIGSRVRIGGTAETGWITHLGKRPNTVVVTLENGKRCEKMFAELGVLYTPPVCRRADINALSVVEQAIRKIDVIIENMPADVRLSTAQHHLEQARRYVAAYYDDEEIPNE